MKFNTLLFDLDGTLTDPMMGITNSVMYALKKYGIDETDRQKLCKFIGPPLSESFEKYYGLSKEQATEAVEFYREYFAPKGLFENAVIEGTEQMLDALKSSGAKMVLATSKPIIFANKILAHFDLDKYFDVTVGSNLDGTLGTKSEVIAEALKLAKVTDRTTAAMIGDRKHDIIGAKENGITPIGVTFGYGSFDELKTAGAEYILDSMKELTEFLLK